MSLVGPVDYSSVMPTDAINTDQNVLNQVKSTPSGKEQLKKVATEFESVFISKMFSVLDQTVDKEGGIFGDETKYYDNFKSYMYNELGRSLASNPNSTFGMAKQIYAQMEKFVK